MGPTWVLSAPGRPHVAPMNLAIGVYLNRVKSGCKTTPLLRQSDTKHWIYNWCDHGDGMLWYGITTLNQECCILLEEGIKAGTSNYIPQILWDVITSPCRRYLLLRRHSSCKWLLLPSPDYKHKTNNPILTQPVTCWYCTHSLHLVTRLRDLVWLHVTWVFKRFIWKGRDFYG